MRAIPERLRDASCGGAVQIDYLYLCNTVYFSALTLWADSGCHCRTTSSIRIQHISQTTELIYLPQRYPITNIQMQISVV